MRAERRVRARAHGPAGVRARPSRAGGDERAPYAEALATHCRAGPRGHPRAGHVSACAGAHPWEDWAETWAHYLHVVDTLGTKRSFEAAARDAHDTDFDAMIELRVEASLVLNALNRSMGLPAPCPFVLDATSIDKLRFVHEALIEHHASGG